jgi:uncharacterized protein YjiS (DUF1127 family)
MASFTQSSTDSITNRLTAATGNLLERAKARYAHHRVYREALGELQMLTDRDLADIGLQRGRLRAIAREAADKKVAL